MNQNGTRPAAWCAAGFVAMTASPTAFRAADPPPPTKRLVEMPTKNLVANAAPQPANVPPPTKFVVERPTKNLVAGAAPANPTVEPGKVKWHPSLADACAASKKSGKPVLLFHMMGQLDKQFC